MCARSGRLKTTGNHARMQIKDAAARYAILSSGQCQVATDSRILREDGSSSFSSSVSLVTALCDF